MTLLIMHFSPISYRFRLSSDQIFSSAPCFQVIKVSNKSGVSRDSAVGIATGYGVDD
jgi:hypothetical protein